MHNQIVEVVVSLPAERVKSKSEGEIKKYLDEAVVPVVTAGLTTRMKGGEAGCSVHADSGGTSGECHVTIRF